MAAQDNTKPEEKPAEQVQESESLHFDSSDHLASAIDWDKDKDKRGVNNSELTGVQLAMADDGHRRPSPFGPAPGDAKPKPVEQPKPSEQQKPAEQQKPVEPSKPADQPKPAEKVGDPSFIKDLPAGVVDSNQRAYEALKTVQPGKPLSAEQRKAFDEALKDASKLEPAFLQEQQKKLVEDVQKDRVLPNGTVLPPWTPEKEKQFVEKLLGTQKAVNELSPEAQKKVGEMESKINSFPPGDLRRGVFQRMLEDEGKKEPKIQAYVDQKAQMDKFTLENAAGLVRRNMHQQEMSVLHSKAVVSGIYAIALDRAGQPADQKQMESLVKDSVRDPFAPANIPEIVGLVEKYKLEEKEIKELEDKVPGRADMRKAMQIMEDEKQGTASERLEKARPFFEKAIGSSAVIDQKKTNEEIEKVSKERNELGENISADKLDELETKAVELIEKARLPYEARMKYAFALQNAAVEKKDPNLSAQAVGMLRSAEALDTAYKLDPVVQGALILAQKNPPEAFDAKKAEEVGKPAVEKIKEEMIKQGKIPDDTPGWQKALRFGGEMLVGAAAFHVLGKYVFGPIGNAKNYIRRSWEMSSRVKGVEAEATPSLKAGEEPRLTYKSKDGKEMPVEGVRKSDGLLRVWNGEKTELVKMRKGDSLVMKVPPDANLSKEQVKELAAKKLTPTGDEAIINEQRTRYEDEIKIRDREIAELKRAQEVMQKQLEARPALEGVETPRVEGEPPRVEPPRTEHPKTEPPKPANDGRPERVVPSAEKLTGTSTSVNPDGSLDRQDARPGEVLAREQLERRDRVEQKEIDSMRRSAEELAKSTKAEDKEKAEALKRTVDALEGKLGAEAQREAHKTMMTESRKALERGEGGGYGRAVAGGLIAVGILSAAALAYYRSSLKAEQEKAIERARVR